MIFKQIPIGMMQNFIYLIGDELTKECAIVDCGWNPDEIIEIARSEKLKITKIILTHYHYDHIQKVNELALKTKAEVYFHENDADQVKKTIGYNPIKINLLKNKINIGNIDIDVLHTPGHTPGSVCLLVEGKLITADTLFVGAIGRCDLPGGDAKTLFHSLQKIKQLSDDIEIYPGHDYGDVPFSTVGKEKKENPYLQSKTEKEFLMFLGY